MSNSFFKFKQFIIKHDKCAMKVGTDGVLLGAWAPHNNALSILDVGTGTGLIALMMAQRNPQATITAIEIDSDAASQAKSNAANSPWSDRIEVICNDFQMFQTDRKYDLIVSNPPYFIGSLNCPDKQRNIARHTNEMNYELLFERSSQLINIDGRICIIIPAEVEKIVVDTAWKYNLHPVQCMRVYTKPGKTYQRLMISFSFQEMECIEESLCIEVERHKYTPEYIALTKEFYLNM